MQTRDIIVIGTSAGGFEALKTLTAGLPATFNASIFIVWHIHPDTSGILPNVLNQVSPVAASNAVDGEAIRTGHIYVAPPNYHMMLEKGVIRLSNGPKENRFRPSVDPLFRSAAFMYGPRVIGIILSGALDDGTSGLWCVKQFGGIAVVQNPDDALVPSMPASALRQVAVDYRVDIADMSQLLGTLIKQPAQSNDIPAIDYSNSIQTEIATAMQDKPGIAFLGEPTHFTCPECHGALSVITEGNITRYRCHTGHAYTADSLLESVSENIEQSLWNAMRGIEEGIMLLNTVGDRHAADNMPKQAAKYLKKASEAREQIALIKKAMLLPRPVEEDREKHRA